MWTLRRGSAEVMPFDFDAPDEAFDGSALADRDQIITRKRLVFGALFAVALTASAVGTWGKNGQDKIRSQRDAARLEATANGLKARTELWALRHGITQVVEVDVPEGAVFGISPFVKLSENPANPNACKVTFAFDGKELVLSQPDMAGNSYDTVKITSGTQAQAALNDICPQ